ncbi:hypothetical protein GCM10027440_54180 [Nocardiopsis coralliicola]
MINARSAPAHDRIKDSGRPGGARGGGARPPLQDMRSPAAAIPV